MDHLKVLKRAGEITWNYRALWIFGIIVALLAGGVRGGGGGPQYSLGAEDLRWQRELTPAEIPPEWGRTLIAAGVALACAIVFLVIASTVLRYVAETALLRMVDDHEETGEKRGVRQGFRLGWSRTALRLFLLDLLTMLAVGIPFIVLFVLAFAPLLLWITENVALGVIGTVAAIGMFFLVVLLAIVVGTVIPLLMYFFRRACALEGLGVGDALREGYGVVRRHLKDVVIMALLMLGVRIAWSLVMLPVVFLLLFLAVLLGGLPALMVAGLTSLFLEGAAPWILAGVLGVPIFILVVAVPGLLLGGLMEVFRSSTWTLTYRELRALEGMGPEPEPLPEPITPDME